MKSFKFRKRFNFFDLRFEVSIAKWEWEWHKILHQCKKTQKKVFGHWLGVFSWCWKIAFLKRKENKSAAAVICSEKDSQDCATSYVYINIFFPWNWTNIICQSDLSWKKYRNNLLTHTSAKIDQLLFHAEILNRKVKFL